MPRGLAASLRAHPPDPVPDRGHDDGQDGDGTREVIARRAFLRLGWAALAWPAILTAGRVIADTLAKTLAELERRTREYQDTLARLLAREEQAVVRATATAERYWTLHAEGLVARRDVEDAYPIFMRQGGPEAHGCLCYVRSQKLKWAPMPRYSTASLKNCPSKERPL
jgi:hypothetical protein